MEKDRAEGRDKRGQFTKGNKAAQKHGIYAISRPGVRGIRLLRQHLDGLKGQLEAQLGDLTPQKQILLGNVLRCEEKLNLLDMWLRKIGIFERDKLLKGRLSLQPASNFYISLMDSQRRALQSLGIDKRASDRLLSPLEFIRQYDEEKAKEEGKDTKEKDTGKALRQVGKGPQRGSQGQILQGKT